MTESEPMDSPGAPDACGDTIKVLRVIYIDGVPHLLCSEEIGWFNNIRREVTFAPRITSNAMLRRVRAELRVGDAIEISAVEGCPGMILRDFRVRSRAPSGEELPISVWPSATRRLDVLLEAAGKATQAPQAEISSKPTPELWWSKRFPNGPEAAHEKRLRVLTTHGTCVSPKVDTVNISVDRIALQVVRDAAAGIQVSYAGSSKEAQAAAFRPLSAMDAIIRAVRAFSW